MGCTKLHIIEEEFLQECGSSIPLKHNIVIKENGLKHYISYDKGCGGYYRYSFHGQEKDDEIYGLGNSYAAQFWQYDPRLGRRWNLDPIIKTWESPYSCFANNPILLVDQNGKDTSVYLFSDVDNKGNPFLNEDQLQTIAENMKIIFNDKNGFILNYVVTTKDYAENKLDLDATDEVLKFDRDYDYSLGRSEADPSVSDILQVSISTADYMNNSSFDFMYVLAYLASHEILHRYYGKALVCVNRWAPYQVRLLPNNGHNKASIPNLNHDANNTKIPYKPSQKLQSAELILFYQKKIIIEFCKNYQNMSWDEAEKKSKSYISEDVKKRTKEHMPFWLK
jgi:RHS repeat-associated protein